MSNKRLRLVQQVRDVLERAGCVVHRAKFSEDSRLGLVSATRNAGTGRITRVPFLFVHLCIGGRGQVEQVTDSYRFRYEVGPNTVGLAPIGEGKGTWPQGGFVTLGIAPSLFREVFRSAGVAAPDGKALIQRAAEPVHDPLVAMLMREMARHDADSLDDPYVNSGLATLLHRMFDSRARVTSREVERATRVNPLSSTERRVIQSHVLGNLDRRVSVEELANLLGLSPYHFSRRFRVGEGISPYQFIIRCKMEKAALRLRESEPKLTVTQIALGLGYNDLSNFARAFQSCFGVSPAEWRRSRTNHELQTD